MNIHGLTIAKGDASMSGITDGALVRAVLRPTLTGTGLNVVTATRLSSNALGSQAGSTDARLEGLITRFTSVRAFSVSGIEVVTSDSTAFEGGTGLSVEQRVEVDGWLSNGVLTARRVELEDEAELAAEGSEFFGQVSGLAPDAGTFTLTTRAGRVFQVRYATNDVAPGDLGDLSNNAWVELKGVLSSNGTSIDATHIEVEDVAHL